MQHSSDEMFLAALEHAVIACLLDWLEGLLKHMDIRGFISLHSTYRMNFLIRVLRMAACFSWTWAQRKNYILDTGLLANVRAAINYFN